MKFHTFSIRTKLNMFVCVIMATALILLAGSFFITKQMETAQKKIEATTQINSAVQDLVVLFTDMEASMLGHLVNPEDAQHLARQQRSHEDAASLFQQIKDATNNAEILAVVAKSSTEEAEIRNTIEPKLIELSKIDPAKARKLFIDQYLATYLKDRGIFEEGRIILEKHVTQAKAELARTTKLSSAILVIIALLVSIVGFIISTRISKSIIGPLTSITERVQGAAEHVDKASVQLSSASQQLSSGASQAASSLEQTSSAMEELTSMVKLNADHSKEASALSFSSRESAEKGETETRQLIEAMGRIAASSKKIEEIIGVIDDIAFQTNLLALNAAVEAARAGEQGRGFAVVADAVRALAEKSANAAKEIATLIKESAGEVETGARIADASGIALKEIVTSVKKVADLNNEIATASNEQSAGLSQINQTVNTLDQATQGNAASAEQAAASSEQLSAQAEILKRLIIELETVVQGGKADTARQGSENQAPSETDKPIEA